MHNFHTDLAVSERADCHWSEMFGTEYMILLSTSLFSAQLMKSTIQDWCQLFLMEERGISVYNAAFFTNFYEIGGILGALFFGILSDTMIRKVKIMNSS